MIAKHTKAVYLFFSQHNPIWQAILGRIPTKSDISENTTINASTLSNWRRGGPIDAKIILRAFAELRKKIVGTNIGNQDRLFKSVGKFEESMKEILSSSDSDLQITELGKVLGMSIEQSQRIIDESIYDNFGMLPAILYGSEAEAIEQFVRFGGNYDLWVRRESHNKKMWLKAALRVRYILNLRAGAVIRCKSNAPALPPYDKELSYWEYDGFLRTRHDKIFWVFEKREVKGRDFFYVITDQGRFIEGRLTLFGTYLTTGQDTAQSIVSSDIVLHKLNPEDLEAALLVPGRKQPRQTDPDEQTREWMARGTQVVYSEDPAYKRIDDLSKRRLGVSL
jgi:hypothetical protein